jgi:hypothetical protein
MTTALTITDADRGNEVATNQALVSVTLKKIPPQYDLGDYLAFADGDRVVFNMHIFTSPVSVDSNLFSGAASFESFVVKAIPTGCEVELELVGPPVLTSISPDTAVSGDPDLILTCTGTDFVPASVIHFGIEDEPTTFVSDTEVTTGVKPSLFAPAVIPVTIRTGNLVSDPVDFTVTEPVAEE